MWDVFEREERWERSHGEGRRRGKGKAEEGGRETTFNEPFHAPIPPILRGKFIEASRVTDSLIAMVLGPKLMFLRKEEMDVERFLCFDFFWEERGRLSRPHSFSSP